MEKIKEFLDLHYFGENGVGPILFAVDVFAVLFIVFIFLYHITKKRRKDNGSQDCCRQVRRVRLLQGCMPRRGDQRRYALRDRRRQVR